MGVIFPDPEQEAEQTRLYNDPEPERTDQLNNILEKLESPYVPPNNDDDERGDS